MARPKSIIPYVCISIKIHSYFNSTAITKCKIGKNTSVIIKINKKKTRLYFKFNKKGKGINVGAPTKVNQAIFGLRRVFEKFGCKIEGKFRLKRDKKKKIWFAKLNKPMGEK